MKNQEIKPIKIKQYIDGKISDTLEYTVDENTRKLIWYSNKNKHAIYQAQEIENGKLVDFFPEYMVDEIIDDIDERISCHNSPARIKYASLVEFNSPKNDPNHELWDKIVNIIKQNPDKYFDDHGDWRKYKVVESELNNALEENHNEMEEH